MLSRLVEWRFLWPGMVHLGATLIAFVLRHVVLRLLERWFGREGPSLLVAAVRLPSIVWCVVLGLYIAIEVASGLPQRVIGQLNLVLVAATVVSVTITLANLLSSVIIRASQRRALHVQVTGLAHATAKAAVLVVGFMVLLAVFGIEITPLLTALGVGGLAVALAPAITVNCVAPGLIEGTRMAQRLPAAVVEGARHSVVLRRTSDMGDIARQVVTFCQADSVTGQVLVVDGGMHFH